MPGAKPFEYELRIDFPNEGRVRLFGADNPDTLRGMYFDGVVLDEPAQMRPSLWPEVIRPALADREGWAAFIGTPKGRNEFCKIYEAALADPVNWFTFLLKASETGLLKEEELEAARKVMTPEQYAQEFECSFEAAILGAYYGPLMAKAQDEGRIRELAWEPSKQVETWWDIGHHDATAIWFVQRVDGWFNLIDFYQMTGMTLPHFVKIVREKPYTYSQHVGPHDLENTDWSGTGKTRREVASGLGIRFEIAPDLSVEDGINAGRLILPKCRFDRQKCAVGVEALRQYRADFDERMNVLRPKPRHDEHSHAADAFRYGALAEAPIGGDWSKPIKYKRPPTSIV